MRILAVNSYRRVLGGAETYLRGVLPALAARGHQVALGWELDAPAGRPAVGEAVEEIPLAESPVRETVARVRAWRPDVVFLHGVSDAAHVEPLREVAPLVHFAHDYRGACVSGLKTWKSVPQPCARPLGPACLLHYYPHRCGGLDPRTMWRDWRRQRRLQAALRRHDAVVVASEHMRAEMVRQGCEPGRVHAPALFAPGVERAFEAHVTPPAPRRLDAEARLLFAGRLDLLKGVHLLVDALPLAAARLGRRVRLVVAGDGPERERLEARARAGGATVEFAGWCDEATLDRHMAAAELLVVPSVWPEPFGLVGPEAGIRGVPAAAFAVGGISSWLTPDENGALADGERPAAAPLADAIAACLADEARWNRLREGAWRLAARFRLGPHVDALERILGDAARGGSRRHERPREAEPASWHESGQ